MDNNFVFSKRLLYATIFGAVVIGGAFYISQKEVYTEPKESSVEETVTITETFSTEAQLNTIEEPVNPGLNVTEEPELTETDILTRNILQPYIEQNNSDTYSPQSKDRIIANATKEMFTLAFTPLEPKDLVTMQDSSKESIIQYKKNLYTAIKPIFELDEYELDIYARAVRDNTKKEFDSLITIADIYTDAGDFALTVSVPNEVSAVHLEIINALYKFAVVLNELAKGYDDPAASLSGTGNFIEVEEGIQHAFSRLQTYFILKEVDKISI